MAIFNAALIDRVIDGLSDAPFMTLDVVDLLKKKYPREWRALSKHYRGKGFTKEGRLCEGPPNYIARCLSKRKKKGKKGILKIVGKKSTKLSGPLLAVWKKVK